MWHLRIHRISSFFIFVKFLCLRISSVRSSYIYVCTFFSQSLWIIISHRLQRIKSAAMFSWKSEFMRKKKNKRKNHKRNKTFIDEFDGEKSWIKNLQWITKRVSCVKNRSFPLCFMYTNMHVQVKSNNENDDKSLVKYHFRSTVP